MHMLLWLPLLSLLCIVRNDENKGDQSKFIFHYSDAIWAPLRFISPAAWLFVHVIQLLDSKGNLQAPLTVHFQGYPKYMNDMFVIRPDPRRFRDSSHAMKPKFSSVGFGFKSVKYFGAKLWNVLPITVKQSDNLFILRTDLQHGVMPTVPLTFFLYLLDAGFILCCIVYHISIIYIFRHWWCRGLSLRQFSLQHIDGGSFGFAGIGAYI